MEAIDSVWFLPKGAYQISFGFTMSEGFRQVGIVPKMFWRSSNHRCGAGGGDFFGSEENDDYSSASDSLFGGEVMGNYYVQNPYGIIIEQDASIVQLCFTHPGANTLVSELLRPDKVERFLGPGRIGRSKTTLSQKEDIPPLRDKWFLKMGEGYHVSFTGKVKLPLNELLVPSGHLSDCLSSPNLLLFSQHSCLGDPGYYGSLGMLVVPSIDQEISKRSGIARVAKQQVLGTGSDLVGYGGQWLEVEDPLGVQERLIEFKNITAWPGLVNKRGRPLEEIVNNLINVS